MKNYEQKNTMTSGKLITTVYASYIYVYISCMCFSGRWAVSEKLGCKKVYDNMDGLNVYSIVQVGGGGAPGMVADDSATSWLDNLESKVDGGASEAPDRVITSALWQCSLDSDKV